MTMAFRIDDDLLAEIKERMNIVDLISDYLPLKKSGSNYLGLCPFHNEKTPSFNVREKEGYYYCFGCHAKGDIFTFLMEKEGLSFPQAVEELARRTGVQLKEKNFLDEEKDKKRARLYSLNREAGYFFMKELAKNKEALDYLGKRGLHQNLIYKYGLGLSPFKDQILCEYLLKKGYTLDEIIEANLAYERTKDKKLVDRFRSRIMFPIIDSRNKILGFGGRQFNHDYGPKYLNSRDTPIFHKGKTLYGLHVVKEKKYRDRIILVEGYMDVISLASVGIYDALASLGTALTKDQSYLLKRYAKEVYVCYDGDEAGQRASKRAIGVLGSVGIKPKIITLKDQMDPDDFIKKEGPDAFELAVKKAKDSIIYLIDDLKQHFSMDSTEGRIGFSKEVAKLLRGIESPVERDVYIDYLGRNFQMNREALREEIQRTGFKNQEGPPRIQSDFRSVDLSQTVNQRILLRLALYDYKIFKDLQEKKIYWAYKNYETAFKAIEAYEEKDFPIAVEDFLNKLEERGLFTGVEEVKLKEMQVDGAMTDDVLAKSLENLRRNQLIKERDQLIEDLQEAEAGGQGDIKELIEQIKAMNDALR